jgi:hypothetical protein
MLTRPVLGPKSMLQAIAAIDGGKAIILTIAMRQYFRPGTSVLSINHVSGKDSAKAMATLSTPYTNVFAINDMVSEPVKVLKALKSNTPGINMGALLVLVTAIIPSGTNTIKERTSTIEFTIIASPRLTDFFFTNTDIIFTFRGQDIVCFSEDIFTFSIFAGMSSTDSVRMNCFGFEFIRLHIIGKVVWLTSPNLLSALCQNFRRQRYNAKEVSHLDLTFCYGTS